MVSIIIVNYNGRELTRACLQSLQSAAQAVEHEIILVDNCSNDGSVEMIQNEFPDVLLLKNDKNQGYGKANNIGVRAAKGELLFFVNNDTLFKQDILSPLKNIIEAEKSTGIVAPMLLNMDGTFQLSYGKYPSIINELRTKRDTALMKHIPDNRSPKNVDWVSFAAVMMRRKVFDLIGGFDERYFMYFEDADLCYRMQKAGYQILYCAECTIIHTGGGSWSSAVMNKIKTEYRRSQIIFYQTHRSLVETLFLRIFLVFRFMGLLVSNCTEERHRVISIIKLALFFDANRN